VDEPSQQHDIYDLLSVNFDNVWACSKTLTEVPLTRTAAEGARNIFVSHGHNEAVKLKVRTFLKEQLGLNPVPFEEAASSGLTIVENLEDITSTCSAAVILFTKENEQKSGGVRSRQNAINELGFCHAQFGRKRVVLALEEGVAPPSIQKRINTATYRQSKERGQ
jgi:predicted nucleotide-binding protein